MTSPQLHLLETLLQEAVALRETTARTTAAIQAQLLQAFIQTIQAQQAAMHSLQEGMLKEFIEQQKDAREVNELKSGALNVFRQFGVSETMHSYLLAHLLTPHGAHGQGHRFLNLFLDRIGIRRTGQSERWSVTAEKHRVDILLVRLDPPAVVIVENKSNNATDQPQQLYRYWYSHIYTPILTRRRNEAEALAPSSKDYRICYLTPEAGKRPTADSLSRPADLPLTLPATLPLPVTHLTFRTDIVAWLTDAIALLPPDNVRLREYLQQYIELWR